MSTIEAFTAIPNALFPALTKVSFSPYEMRVLLCIWRKTFGYQRAGCYTSYRDIAALTHIDVRHVHRSVKVLCEKNVFWKKTTGKGTYITFNVEASTWVLPAKDDDRQMSLRLGPIRVINRPVSVASSGNGHGNEVLPVEATEVLPVAATLLKKKESIKERAMEAPLERLFG